MTDKDTEKTTERTDGGHRGDDGSRCCSPVGMTSGGHLGFTVSYAGSRIVWVSSLRYGGFPEWKTGVAVLL